MKPIKQSKDDDDDHHHHQGNNPIKIWDCGSPLYDAYEMVAISHIVERHFMSLPYLPATSAAARSTKLLLPSDHHTHYNPPSSSDHHKPAVVHPKTTKSSVLSFLMSPFVEKRSAETPWKRKMGVGAERKMQRAKRHKVNGVSMLFHFPWKKL